MTPDVTDDSAIGQSAEEVCGVLAGILQEGVDIHRCLAAQAMGKIGDSRAVEPLVAALLDEDEDVRTDAAGALAALADHGATSQLMENLLGDPCTDVKLAAIDALVRLKEPEVIPWLQKLIKGRDEDIAWDDTEFYESGWDDWVDIQVKAILGLAELGIADSIPDFLEAMQDEDAQELSETVFKALTRLGDPGVETLAGFLDDPDELRRRRAIMALSAITNETVSGLLAAALDDPSSMVRLAALQAMAERDPSAPGLPGMMEDDDSEVRAEAVRLCAAANPDRLLVLAGDKDTDVLKAVLGVLIEQPELIEAETLRAVIRPKLDHPDPHLTSVAAMVLAESSPQETEDDLVQILADPKRPVETRIGALRGLSRINSAHAVQSIIGVIADKERPLRVEAMAALAAIARADAAWPNSAGTALLQALKGEWSNQVNAVEDEPEKETPPPAETDDDEDTDVTDGDEDPDDAIPTSTLNAIMADHPAAAKAFDLPDEGVELTPMDMERLALASRIKGKKSLPVVPKVAPHQDIRQFAARVLGDLTEGAVAGALAVAISDEDKDVRHAATDSLARFAGQTKRLPDTAADVLLGVLNDSDRNVRLAAVRALGFDSEKRAVDALEGRLEDEDSFVRTEAIRSLSGMGEAAPKIVALLADPDPGVRLAAADAVADTGGEDAVESLVDFAFAFEGYHRREAGRILRRLNPGAANARFLDALEDQDAMRLWPVAIEALEELNSTDNSETEKAVIPTA